MASTEKKTAARILPVRAVQPKIQATPVASFQMWWMILEDLFCRVRPQNFNAVESAWRERFFISKDSNAAALKQEILENAFDQKIFLFLAVNLFNKYLYLKIKFLVHESLVIRGCRSYLRRVSASVQPVLLSLLRYQAYHR